MSNQNLSDAQFGWVSRTGDRYSIRYEPGFSSNSIVAETADGTARAGHLTWGVTTGEVGNVQVRDAFRRQGLATEMWRRAKEIDPEVYHSDRLSNDAKAWIEGMGNG